jgi:colanic acid/amylovoran biosynthesis glycosyltransferase
MYPANFLTVKGHTYVLQAVARLKERGIFCQLFLAGQGPLANNLYRQVNELEIRDRVKFLGQLAHDALLQYYTEGSVDAVVLASVDLGNGEHEGIPVCLIEAMAHRIPVIATATGGIPELINEGTGILIPHHDANALADAIEQLLKDTCLRQKLAQAGYQQVKEGFNVERSVDRLCQLICK